MLDGDAVALAGEWEIEQTFVGLVLIEIGTSLPVLAIDLSTLLAISLLALYFLYIRRRLQKREALTLIIAYTG